MNSIYLVHKSIGELVDLFCGDSYALPLIGIMKPIPIQRSKPVSLQNLQPIFNC